MADVNRDGRADLVHGRPRATIWGPTMWWLVHPSTGSSFGTRRLWTSDGGAPGDGFYLADVNGDLRADLVRGRTQSDTAVTWSVQIATPFNSFRPPIVWNADGGDTGDFFRLGDGDGDGRADLFAGSPVGVASRVVPPDLLRVRWTGNLSTGGSFATGTTWATDAGDEGTILP